MATHARLAPRPAGAARARTWWGKAWVRAVEEAAYAEEDLVRGRRLARAGRVGGITVEPGRFVAAVEEGDDVLTVSGGLPELDPAGSAALTEVVAAESGRIAALLGGDLPHPLVEHAEESGVELLPFGGELATRCTCEPWADPCHHALAVLQQLTWLIEADPFVLLALRGVGRDDLLARLHALSEPADRGATDLDVAADAARRAGRLLELLDDPDASLDHLW
ncbi:hypothetical protein [Nocardioides sp. GXQ0305]|uniref:SWIM zinc finger family protein n=1 Tax=Nocardioides sp. GXQ0305 TaxID=3423912 RepID=UPI003D7D627B